MKCRWFLAHAKQTPDDIIDAWAEALRAQLTGADVEAEVTPGRDDYLSRSRAMGGWNTWVKDVPVAEDWSGSALFHGIVVPCDMDRPTVGRATQALIEGFITRGKYAYAWDINNQTLRRVHDVADTMQDSWIDAAVLLLEEA